MPRLTTGIRALCPLSGDPLAVRHRFYKFFVITGTDIEWIDEARVDRGTCRPGARGGGGRGRHRRAWGDGELSQICRASPRRRCCTWSPGGCRQRSAGASLSSLSRSTPSKTQPAVGKRLRVNHYPTAQCSTWLTARSLDFVQSNLLTFQARQHAHTSSLGPLGPNHALCRPLHCHLHHSAGRFPQHIAHFFRKVDFLRSACCCSSPTTSDLLYTTSGP